VALGLDLEHCEAVFLIEESDALDQSRKALHKSCGTWLRLFMRSSSEEQLLWSSDSTTLRFCFVSYFGIAG
jgi:hypothetical protein